MIFDVLKYLFFFIFSVAIQILLFNNLPTSYIFKPQVYIYFIIILPIFIPRWAEILMGFVLGMTIDFFTNTPGVNALATLIISYVRYFFTKDIKPEANILDGINRPNKKIKGEMWYFIYLMVLIFIHHSILFFTEAFGFHLFIRTIGTIIFSSILTFLMLILFDSIFFKEKKTT